MASFSLMLLDTDESTTILSTISVDKLKAVQKEWVKTHRATAIQKEEKRRQRLKLQKHGGFINVWPDEDIQRKLDHVKFQNAVVRGLIGDFRGGNRRRGRRPDNIPIANAIRMHFLDVIPDGKRRKCVVCSGYNKYRKSRISTWCSAAKRPRLTTRPSSSNAATKQKIGQQRKTLTGARPATSTSSITNQTLFPRKFQTRTVQIAATDAELKDYTRKTHSLTLQDLPKTKGDAQSEETGIYATNATSSIVVETPLEQTEKRNAIAKVGIHTARREEENDEIQEENNSDLFEPTPSIQSISDNDTVLSETTDLDKFLSDIKDSLTSSAESIRKKKVLPSLPATRQWKPPQDELPDVLPVVDMVLSSKDTDGCSSYLYSKLT
ncbi:unnamed protein product [Mytilus coruscus]|uniref:Uncharacterized protein n=1 Tax=Mytilus coruscus TaxID=42192 RepID=A0A6J8DJK0_MYTCO|nr:unnamed protein product [Mytilus coruscus]